jgi:hypothetical protein
MYGDPTIPLTPLWEIKPFSHRLDAGATDRARTMYLAEEGELHMESRQKNEANLSIGNLLNFSEEQRNQHCSYESAVKIPYTYGETPCTALAVWNDDRQMWRLDDEERPEFYVEIVHIAPDQ